LALLEKETISKAYDKYARIKYEEIQIKVIPKVKLSFLLGLKICHKKGIPNNKIGNAVIPVLRLTSVNQYAITVIKYKYGINFE
jgi:hypothetical protein